MAKALRLKAVKQFCPTYNAAYFEGIETPSLVLRTDNYKAGQLVIYVDRSRYSYRNKWFLGKVVRPHEAGIENPDEGVDYPLTLEDFGI